MSVLAVQRPDTVSVHTGPAARKEGRTLTGLAILIILTLAVVLASVNLETRYVLAPAAAVIVITLFYLVVLTNRQGHLPVFEAATYFVLATSIYALIPLIQFVAVGMEWMPGSDFRLVQWRPTPRQFGGFAWRHVLLLATFVATYLLVRGKRLWRLSEMTRPTRHMTLAIVTTVLICSAYLMAIDLYVGPTLSPYEGGSGLEYLRLPHFVLQTINVAMMMKIILKQCLLIVLLSQWKVRKWRFLLLFWLVCELAMMVTALESRTMTVILVLTFLVGFHHLVRPLRIGLALMVGVMLLGGFLAFGLVRDIGVYNIKTNRELAWGAPNEFQVLFGNAYDIYRRKQDASLPSVPWQIPFSDIYRLVPSQLLPFYKWEPSVWYRNEVLELRDSGMGFMFGIVAQSCLGFDWIELFARGVLLALFYAAAHRVWRRYSASFWVTVTYLFILTWTYYAFRSSSFEILYRLVYYLAPAAIVVKLLTVMLSVPVRLRRRDRFNLTRQDSPL